MLSKWLRASRAPVDMVDFRKGRVGVEGITSVRLDDGERGRSISLTPLRLAHIRRRRLAMGRGDCGRRAWCVAPSVGGCAGAGRGDRMTSLPSRGADPTPGDRADRRRASTRLRCWIDVAERILSIPSADLCFRPSRRTSTPACGWTARGLTFALALRPQARHPWGFPSWRPRHDDRSDGCPRRRGARRIRPDVRQEGRGEVHVDENGVLSARDHGKALEGSRTVADRKRDRFEASHPGLELLPLASARDVSSQPLFSRAASRDQVIPPDRDLL